ncbi:gamma-glutamyltransferase [Melghirimyces algeriensis]|uniref:Glutathione hydrolase proenzyme n=1 Tax=Melghirimyces algeriensis TaxID=910412 RepID=A0A521AC96_9BACL|nr:gamma-glutamyltransferase [Melghirimyces algeriensis]SMO32320.1 gamma-glutamyltransferase 1 Threonine peptidase. MEROPS family T03 [Melghirimyces algeriensis]
MSNRLFHIMLTLVVIFGMAGVTWYKSQSPYDNVLMKRPGIGEAKSFVSHSSLSYGVAAAHPLAANVGMDVLENGGNAVDAAIAVSYVLGTVEMHGSGVGGGGTMLVHPGKHGEPVVYDYREIAPMSGQKPEKGVGVPGFVMGMERVHQDFGSQPLAKLIEPAVRLAEEGYHADWIDRQRLNNAAYRMPIRQLPHLYPDGAPVEEGELIRQEELAQTYRKIQQHGANVFYRGEIAKRIVQNVDGLTMNDFARYQVLKKKPLRGSFAGYEVLAPPAPSGGTMFIQSLQMAEALKIEDTRNDPATFHHLMGEINRRAYKHRLKTVGDPKFVQVDEQTWTDPAYARELAKDISPDRLLNEKLELDSEADREDHDNTTHFVVVDKNGMMVSVTNTVSHFFGSGIYVDGFFLNNQLKNFSLSASSPNRIQGGKRPYSYTTPAIFAKDKKPVLGIGSAGGRRIPAMVNQVVIRHLLFGQPLEQAMAAPRSVGEIGKNTITVEEKMDLKAQQALRQRGYRVDTSHGPLYFGGIQTLKIDYRSKKITGGADPRRSGVWRTGW